jgi:hypothetical protein
MFLLITQQGTKLPLINLELLLEEVLDSYQNQPWQVDILMEKLSN